MLQIISELKVAAQLFNEKRITAVSLILTVALLLQKNICLWLAIALADLRSCVTQLHTKRNEDVCIMHSVNIAIVMKLASPVAG